MDMIGVFILGCTVGGTIGVILSALCTSASRTDECMECQARQYLENKE